MRVLFVAGAMPSPGKPGTLAPVARQIESLAPHLDSYGILEITGRPIVKYIRAISEISRKSSNYDLVHAHYGLCGFSAVRGSRIPVVISLMGSDIQNSPDRSGLSARIRIIWEHMVSRYACKRAESVIVKNRKMAERIASVDSVVVPNGVNTLSFAPVEKREARARLGLKQEETLVLFGGNPSDMNKNYPLAETALKIVRETLGRSIKCIPLKGIKPDAVPLHMNACDCMLFTSLEEGSPNVVKEAMACNTPIVSVPVGDTEYLLNGVEGCRLCPYDPADLASALAEILKRGAPSEGRQAINDRKLDMESVARRILAIYRHIV